MQEGPDFKVFDRKPSPRFLIVARGPEDENEHDTESCPNSAAIMSALSGVARTIEVVNSGDLSGVDQREFDAVICSDLTVGFEKHLYCLYVGTRFCGEIYADGVRYPANIIRGRQTVLREFKIPASLSPEVSS